VTNCSGAAPSGLVTAVLPGKVPPTGFGFAAPPAGQDGNAPAATVEISVGGFSTAGGRPIMVSEAARQRAAGWLANVLRNDEDGGGDVGGGMLGDVKSSGPGDLGGGPSVMTTSVVGVKAAGGAVSEAAKIGRSCVGALEAFGAAAAIPQGSAVGFSTAGGKPVIVSEAARKRAEGWLSKIMNDEDEEGGGGGVPALAAAVMAAANVPETLPQPGPALRLPRSDSAPYKPSARRRAVSLGPDTGAAHFNTSTTADAAAAAAAAVGTGLPPTSPLPDAQSPQLRAMPQRGSEAGMRSLSGAFAAPSGLGCQLLPAASIVALPPAAIALPRSGTTFPSGRPVVLGKRPSMYATAATERKSESESGAPAEAEAAEAKVPAGCTQLVTAMSTDTAPTMGALAADVAAAAPAGATAGGRTAGGEASFALAGGGQQASAAGAVPAFAAAVSGNTDPSAGDRETLADGAGFGTPAGFGATVGLQASAEKQATGFVTGNGIAVLVDSARLAAAAALLQVVGSDAAEVSPSGTRKAREQALGCEAEPQGVGPHGQSQAHLLPPPPQQQLLEQQPSATTSPVALPVAVRAQANTSLSPAIMAASGSQMSAVGEEHRGPGEEKTPSPPAAAATVATFAKAVEDAAANTGERTRAVAQMHSAFGMSDKVVAGGDNLDVQAGVVHPPPAPRQPAPAFPLSATAATTPIPTKLTMKSTDGSELSHVPVTDIPIGTVAASGTEQHTPLRTPSLLPGEAAAAVVAATASAASTPRATPPRMRPVTTTPGSGLRAGPPPSTGGLKRPRTLASSGSGAGPTHGSGRPPRHGGAATAPPAAGVGNKRKFVSPLPAGYKGKPGSADCSTPLRGDTPAAASRAAWGGSDSAKRRGGQGSPKRPRLSSLFELEAGIGGRITKLPLQKYFTLPLAPGAGTSPPTSPGPHRAAVVGGEVPIAATEVCGNIAGAGDAPPIGAVGAMADADAMAVAVAAAAPSRFTPVAQGVLDEITSATAAEFRFWAALEAPSPQSLPQPEENKDVRSMDTEPHGHEAAQSAVAGGTRAAAAAASMVWGWWGAAEARAALQRLMALPLSARERATDPWVTNHYRWIVWKLAAYERRALPRP
ncbi:hypothetical protein Vafri_13523, partial [Volvox africanus]